jgi:hypothetical protein
MNENRRELAAQAKIFPAAPITHCLGASPGAEIDDHD